MTTSTSPLIGVLLAGGLGSRFGGDTPKQLALLAGRPIIAFAAATFDAVRVFDRLIVAARPAAARQIAEACAASIHRTPFTVVDGGASRNESVAHALATIDDDDARVLVHDAVRPLVSGELVRAVADGLLHSRSVMPVIPAADRLVEVRGGTVTGFGDQDVLMRGQSPGGFWLRDLRPAFEHNARSGARGFRTVFELVRDWDPDYRISAIPGEDANIKITFPLDHAIASHLLVTTAP